MELFWTLSLGFVLGVLGVAAFVLLGVLVITVARWVRR